MPSFPFIYISPYDCQGSHQGGWHRPLAAGEGPPPVNEFVESLPQDAFQTERVGVVLEDDLLHPLRVQLDQKVGAKDLPPFLLWKLKRLLPYPVDQVALRYLPLRERNAYLTFSLPKPWVAALDQAFRDKGVHCGYMGGLFATLLENRTSFRNGLSLALYRDFYVQAELDGRGGYLDYRTRRLPYTQPGQLDVDTLVRADWEPILRARAADQPVRLLNLAPELDGAFAELARTTATLHPRLSALPLEGGTLDRFLTCMNGMEDAA